MLFLTEEMRLTLSGRGSALPGEGRVRIVQAEAKRNLKVLSR